MGELPRIAVCDDSLETQQRISDLLLRYREQHPERQMVFHTFSNKAELLGNQETLDLLFLDIELGEDSGIALVPLMQQKFPDLIIIFISTHTKYFVYSHRLNVFQFLVKPFDVRIFFEELDRFYHKYYQRHALYHIDFKGKTTEFPITEILYMEASLRHLYIYHEKTGMHEKVGQISREEAKLKLFGFIRCHSGFLVNARYIDKIKNQTIYLNNPYKRNMIEIPISKAKLIQTKQQYQQWLLQQGG